MLRNQTNSDLVPVGHSDEIHLYLNPTQELSNPPVEALLEIDNVGDATTRSGGHPGEGKPGRGLSDLIVPCHDRLTVRDVHMFRVLTKIVRAEAEESSIIKIAIFRGARDDTYRIDLRPIAPNGQDMGRMAVELEVEFGPDDSPQRGSMRVLDECGDVPTNDCTDVDSPTQMWLIRPQARGELWAPTPYTVDSVGTFFAEVDFADLLGESTWHRPL